MTAALLIHGGLWEEVNADFFWRRTGIVAGLERHGVRVLSPDRVPRATSWAAEAEHLAAVLPDDPVTIIAGSNGCSAAVRLALTAPDRVERLLLAWPATAGDPEVDTETRAGLAKLGASRQIGRSITTSPSEPRWSRFCARTTSDPASGMCCISWRRTVRPCSAISGQVLQSATQRLNDHLSPSTKP